MASLGGERIRYRGRPLDEPHQMLNTHGAWVPTDSPRSEPRCGRAAVIEALECLDRPFSIVATASGPAVTTGGRALIGDPAEELPGALPLLAHVPALTPDQLGDPSFQHTYGVRVGYVGGAMANGIASEALVVALARAGALGFFGAAGLSLPRIEAAIEQIKASVGGLPWGSNLIHSPADPQHEQQTVELYLQHGVTTVSASAYMSLTPPVVQYRVTGLSRGPDGAVRVRNRLLAKVSRPEVAERFLRPAPARMLAELVAAGRITTREAELAAELPMADDLTAEADSGGHTDNRPLPVLLPLLIHLRDRVGAEIGHPHRIRIGAAGGIGAPEAAAAAFAMGAAYVLTGTIHQATVEAGTSDLVREMLASASMADVAMAPASDMFEGGVQLQVLKRGTLFPQRARLLYALYRDHGSLEELPPADAEAVQRTVLRASFDEIWAQCVAFFSERDPTQLARAGADPKHRMALIFRWYLGRSSRWAIAGDAGRRTDLQIWCGPAIGAFNDWTRDTFLADPRQRHVDVVAANLMAGAAFHTRAVGLAAAGVDVGPIRWRPRALAPASPQPPREPHVRS